MLAGALRRSCCRQGTVGTEDCRQGRCSEELSGRCWQAGALWQRYCCQGEPSGRCCWLGHRSGRDTAGRGTVGSCWKGRRGRATGRKRHGEEDCGTVAESHLEDTAGRGAAVAKILLARALRQNGWLAGAAWQSCCRQLQKGITAQKKESDP